jgi:hypothetical protein
MIAGGQRAIFSTVLILAACGAGGTATTSNSEATTTAGPTTPPTTTTISAIESWAWGVGEVDLGDGYALGPCSGDADQFACISRNGSVIGSAEHLAFPVDAFDFLDGVDDPAESIELIAADYVSTFTSDREATCPNLEFVSLVPTTSTIGGREGLRYGFEELDEERVVEKNVIYGVRGDETIDLFGFSAIAEGACLSNEGELTDPEVLDFLLPRLDQAIAVVDSG